MEQGKIMEAEVPTVQVGPTPTTPQGFLQAGCPSCRPTNSVKALKALKALKAQLLYTNATIKCH